MVDWLGLSCDSFYDRQHCHVGRGSPPQSPTFRSDLEILVRQNELAHLVAEILGDDYRRLRVWNYRLSEDLEGSSAQIICAMQMSGDPEIRSVEGSGVGLIDALFKGLKISLGQEFPSLEDVFFADFGISADFEAPSSDVARSDALVRVCLAVENSTGRRFEFSESSQSVTGASVTAVVRAAEHFVNAEMAVLRVYDWVLDAQRRGRPVLAERYLHRLADLTQNASYSQAIERRRQQHEAG